MDVILIPGFWLDASSWDEVAPLLREAGHSVHPLTLPGLESPTASRASIGLRDHVNAVIAVVDEFASPVVLVGHSGGGAIAHAVADARPDRVARVVYVDSLPLGDGQSINDELPATDDEIPLPPWDAFDDPDLTDLTPALREMFRERAIPEPAGVARDAQQLGDERRYDVPATVIACEFSAEQLREWMAGDGEWVRELAALHDLEIVELPTGHWPQFTRPRDLAAAIIAAVDQDVAPAE